MNDHVYLAIQRRLQRRGVVREEVVSPTSSPYPWAYRQVKAEVGVGEE
jgi:hypothetical protein